MSMNAVRNLGWVHCVGSKSMVDEGSHSVAESHEGRPRWDTSIGTTV